MDINADVPNTTFFEDDAEESEDNLDEDPESFNFSTSAIPLAEPSSLPRHSPVPFHQQIRQVGIFFNKRRRAATEQALLGGATAWVDQDDSGTYDPKLARKTPPLRKRAKRRRPAEELDENGNSRPKKRGRTSEYGGLITFSFTSKKALEYLRSISPGPFSDNSEESSLETGHEDGSSGSGSFRRRKRTRQVKKPTQMLAREDGLTIDGLTIGHPQRRGCKACFQAGNDECTLIDDGQDYPCEACEDAGVDCELIVPPELKRSCERCKASRKQCSYRHNKGKGMSSCSACDEEGVRCVAGPLLKSSSRTDDILDLTPERAPPSSPPPIRPRMYVACNQCRNFGKRCSLRSKSDPGPCSCCRKTNQHCHFVFIPPSQLAAASGSGLRSKHNRCAPTTPRSRRRPEDTNTAATRNAIGKEVEKISNKWTNREAKKQAKNSSSELIGYTRGNKHIFITTSFCHPIHFNYQPDAMSSEPCSWCSNPLFGIFGLDEGDGPRRIEGFYDADGSGFKELNHGFRSPETGIKPSKMCISCTFDRINIMGCPSHQTRTLTPQDCAGWEYNAAKWTQAWDAFQAGDVASATYLLAARWCAICPSLAHRKCGGGCGLLLCDTCDELLGKMMKSGVWQGDRALDALVREITIGALRWVYPDGVRADASFLTSGGELCQRLKRNFGLRLGAGTDEFPTPPTNSSPTSPAPAPGFTHNTNHSRTGNRSPKAKDLRADENELDVHGASDAETVKLDRKGKGKDMRFFEAPFNPITLPSIPHPHTHPHPHHNRPSQPSSSSTSSNNNNHRERERGKITWGGRVAPRLEDVERAFGGGRGGGWCCG